MNCRAIYLSLLPRFNIVFKKEKERGGGRGSAGDSKRVGWQMEHQGEGREKATKESIFMKLTRSSRNRKQLC